MARLNLVTLVSLNNLLFAAACGDDLAPSNIRFQLKYLSWRKANPTPKSLLSREIVTYLTWSGVQRATDSNQS